MGCQKTVTVEDVRKNVPSFKVWKEETFYNDTGGIKVIHRFSKDSIYKWTMTCFPSDSGCYVTEYRNRTLLYMENSLDNGWVYIDYIVTDDTVKRPAYKSMAFYPSGQVAFEGVRATVSGHPATNCDDVYTFSLNTDSNLKDVDGTLWSSDWEVEIGTWKHFHENGKLRLVEQYDTAFGQCVEYINHDEAGFSSSYSVSTLAIRDGTAQHFNERGELIKTETWQKGRLVKEESYD